MIDNDYIDLKLSFDIRLYDIYSKLIIKIKEKLSFSNDLECS